MRVLVGLVLSLGACGGTDGDTVADVDTTDDTVGTVDPCEGMPEYDLTGVTCSQAASVWEDLVDFSDACTTASDCSLLSSECDHWNDLGCYYAHNDCFTQELISALNAAAPNCSNGQTCACTGSPDVDCVGGKCVVLED